MTSTGKGHFFPLTSLQIGDLQSYLSRLTIFLAPDSRKVFILLDNRPWLVEKITKPCHLWQYMVTKSRLSPFANNKTRKKKNGKEKNIPFSNNSQPTVIKKTRKSRWLSLVDQALLRKSELLQVNKLKNTQLLNMELHRTLFGLIIFEVDWAHVCGINYLNELQTDTLMALETKTMRRWEFDSVEQARRSISSWFAGSHNERKLLMEFLDSVSTKVDVFYDAREDSFMCSNGNQKECNDGQLTKDKCSFDEFGEKPCDVNTNNIQTSNYSPHKRRKIIKSGGGDIEEPYSEVSTSKSWLSSLYPSSSSDSEDSSIPFEVGAGR